jgi:hypothetical protein
LVQRCLAHGQQNAPTWNLVHEGSVAVEFRPLDFVLGRAEALGWHESPDTVRIILDPSVDHGAAGSSSALWNNGSCGHSGQSCHA